MDKDSKRDQVFSGANFVTDNLDKAGNTLEVGTKTEEEKQEGH